MNFKFKITKKSENSLARAGVIKTPRGEIKIPCFMPVATCGAIKGLTPDEMRELGADILLSNTYHLWLRPGQKTVKKMGGLHKFMNWDGPIITDSGGFQAFSLGYGMEHKVGKMLKTFIVDEEQDNAIKQSKTSKVEKLAIMSEEGVKFKSHLDGTSLLLTPEKSIQIQHALGSDIILVLDECTSPLCDYEYTKDSLERSHRWEKRSLDEHKRLLKKNGANHAIFGILQGGPYKDLREKAVEFVNSQGFDGFAIGGNLGRNKQEMWQILEWVNPALDQSKPRHLLGIGGVDDFFECVERGVDMFDCVSPSRLARQGMLYISTKSGGKAKNKWRIHIKNEQYKLDKKPIDPNCKCKVCQKYSRAYINHLFRAGELLGLRLATEHNLYFILNLMKEIREAIEKGKLRELKREWIEI